MASDLHDYLARDHERLDALLARIVRSDGSIDQESYTEFKSGLLRHIGIEERILFPEIRRRRGDSILEQQLHREHAALAALLMPPPTPTEIEQINAILAAHNPLEEEPGGLYEVFETLAGDELSPLLERVREFPFPRLAPPMDTAVTRSSIEILLRDVAEGQRKLRESRGKP